MARAIYGPEALATLPKRQRVQRVAIAPRFAAAPANPRLPVTASGHGIVEDVVQLAGVGDRQAEFSQPAP
jgi:hypothetical protein